VTQAGQSVDHSRIRFDFTHNKPVSDAELQQIEAMVNAEISKGIAVTTDIMNPKDAVAKGAMALFGEKYGDKVRVLSMGDFSVELCGGTHVANTAMIRVFKILTETGVSSGVRRIEAIAGDQAIDLLMNKSAGLQSAMIEAGVSENLTGWIQSKKDEIKNLEKEIKKSKTQSVSIDDQVKAAIKVSIKGKDTRLLSMDVDVDDRDVLMNLADQGKSKLGSGIVVIVGKGNDSGHPIVVSVSKDIIDSLKAGDLLKQISQSLGGKGGGRPDFAQGAVIKKAGLPDFLKTFFS
jgi:alanyl-tRNA synthetase